MISAQLLLVKKEVLTPNIVHSVRKRYIGAWSIKLQFVKIFSHKSQLNGLKPTGYFFLSKLIFFSSVTARVKCFVGGKISPKCEVGPWGEGSRCSKEAKVFNRIIR